MVKTLQVSTLDAVSSLFHGGNANVSWVQALDGLNAEQAHTRPPGLPHSVAEVVAHVQFWQAYLLSVLRGEHPPDVAHAAQGWPEPGEWAVLQETFFRDLSALAALAQDEAFMSELDPQDRFRIVPLTSYAGHGLYHLGQVVTVRQLIGAWPPPGGGDSW
ncbi:DinB family protein [Deinococcus sonorensis]|uniref:DinB family protein n=2 Tax=Deinococcus sonorensis TaxID=309891 RepID=A0AAU7U9R8_9DEIO